MSARSKARRRALDVLFAADVRGIPAAGVLTDLKRRRAAEGEPGFNPYTDDLVGGVVANLDAIDARVGSLSVGWPLDRMPAVDRNILRIGAFELLYATDVPSSVAVSEAVLLAKELSTDDSPRFINGLLSRLARLDAENTGEAGSGRGKP